jgi:hypothetical protein
MSERDVKFKPGVVINVHGSEVVLPRLKPNVVDVFLSDPKYIEGYEGITNLHSKYAIAYALIEDGRIEDPVRLVREFMPPKIAVDSISSEAKRRENREIIKTQGQYLKDQLSLELIKRGKLKIDSPEAHDAQNYLRSKYRNDPLMRKAMSLAMPPHVAAELQLIEMLHGASDLRKLQELRSWNVQAAYSAALGRTRGRINRTDVSTFDLIDQLPREVFPNKEYVEYNLVQHWLESVFMRTVTDAGVDVALPYLEEKVNETEDPDKKAYLQRTLDRFLHIATESPARTLKREIEVNGMKKTFASFEQTAFKYDYINNETRMLCALTGFGKTGAAFDVLESSDMSRGLIIAPASARKTWLDEERKLFEKPGQIRSIETSGDLLELYIRSKISPPQIGRETFSEARQRITREVNERVGFPVDEKAIEGAMVRIGYVTQNTPNELIARRHAKQILRARVPFAKYTVVGQELLGLSEKRPYVIPMLFGIIEGSGMDGGVIDEFANLSNFKNTSTKAVFQLLRKLRENYIKKHPNRYFHEAPIIGLTATPYKSEVSDLDVPMAMLYPHLYAPENTNGSDIKTFSKSVLNSFVAAHAELVGGRRMSRWEQASGIQEYEEEYQAIELSPFEKYLYTFIVDEIETGNFVKSRLLSDVVLNPILVKGRVRELDKGSIPEFDSIKAKKDILNALEQWKSLKRIHKPTGDIEDYFTVSSLVDLGLGETALAGFFSREYVNGIDSFVDEITRDTDDPALLELREFWMSNELSSKYKAVEEIVAKYGVWREDENGNVTRWQIRFIAEDHVQGRSRDFSQETIIDDDGAERSLYEEEELAFINDTKFYNFLQRLAVKYNISAPEDVVMVDGSIGIGKRRDAQYERIKQDTNVALVLLGKKATYQSRDLTLTGVMDEQARDIEGVLQVSLGPDWYFANKRQMAGRCLRHGQLVPFKAITLVADGTYDESRKDNEIFTAVVEAMMLGGVQPTDEQLQILRERIKGEPTLPYYSKESRFLAEALSFVTGAGKEAVLDFGNRIQPDQVKSNFERIAEKLYDNGNDMYHSSGYNADFVAKLIRQRGLLEKRIVAAGAGTLLLQRRLGYGIDNVDYNPHIMDIAWDAAKIYGGRKIVASVDEFPEEEFPNGSVGVLENAFALHWSELLPKSRSKKSIDPMDSERVRILIEANRVLEENGLFVLTVPEDAFDVDTFIRFAKTLEHNFGLTVDYSVSGEVYGETKFGRRKQVSWSIVATKTGDITLDGLNVRSLSFLKDKEYWTSDGRKPKIDKIQDGLGLSSALLMMDFDQYVVRSPFGGSIVDGALVEIRDMSFSNGHSNTNNMDEFEIATDASSRDNGYYLFSGEFDIQSLEDQLVIVRGFDDEEYKKYYRKLLRNVERSIGLSWEEADDFCVRAIQYAYDKGITFATRQAAHEYVYKVLKSPKKLEEIFFYGI